MVADARDRIQAPAVSAARDRFDRPPGFDLGERLRDIWMARAGAGDRRGGRSDSLERPNRSGVAGAGADGDG
jgi:hypothetical protein